MHLISLIRTTCPGCRWGNKPLERERLWGRNCNMAALSSLGPFRSKLRLHGPGWTDPSGKDLTMQVFNCSYCNIRVLVQPWWSFILTFCHVHVEPEFRIHRSGPSVATINIFEHYQVNILLIKQLNLTGMVFTVRDNRLKMSANFLVFFFKISDFNVL